MRRPIVSLITCAWLAMSVQAVLAATANPALNARDSGIHDADDDPVPLDIADLDVQVDIVGNVARTTVAARFTNPGNDDLEGTFTLQMPDGAVVTSYALDVEGKMIEGVLTPPIRARRAYEEKVRQGIDPGVAEVALGNVFSTRVYPVLAGVGRTIRVTFAAPVHAEQGFTLPLRGKAGRVGLRVRVRGAANSPQVVWPASIKPGWVRSGEDFVSEVTLRKPALTGELHIALADNDGRAFVTRHPSGKRFVELRDAVSAALPAMRSPGAVRVYWDRSLSRADDALADELRLLEKYLAALPGAKLEVVPFNSSGANARAVPDAAAALSALRAVRYRGASSFAALGQPRAPADVCLLFSDGIANIDARPEAKLDCTLFAITSARDADRGYLELLTRLNGGAVLAIDRGNVDELLRHLRSPAPRVIDVRSTDGRALRFAPLPAGARGWALISEAPAAGEVIVRVAGMGSGVIERRYALTHDGGRFAGAGALWAFDRVSQVLGDGRREPELRDLSMRYSVASPAMSFVVLESPEDYIRAKIAPPASYPKDALAEYRALKREYDAEEAGARARWLEDLVAAWEDQKDWWTREFDVDTRAKKIAPRGGRPAEGVDSIAAQDIGALPNRAAAEALQRVAPALLSASADSLDEIAVTGMRASDPEISVELEPWNPERPYLKALEAAGAAGYERALLVQMRKFGALPVFYFDVAEWLHRKGRSAQATEILLSALELPSRDTETLSLVADRLLRYAQTDRAVWLYEEVVRLDPDRPQPARTLALALAQRASLPGARTPRKDLERSLALLTAIVMSPPQDAFQGVELVCLMDANGIIPRLRELGVRKFDLDQRLIAVLDVDLRVVIEWNTGATDMDLWVDQPDGERSIYSNRQTAIGGRLSNDMTQGYGPEEYLLRRAIAGQYAISVNVYASDVLNPNGATMVTAHLTRNFGRADQSTETMEIELQRDDSGQKLVGRFNVGPRDALSRR